MLRILAVLFLLVGSVIASAEPVFPPGLRVGLEPAGDLKSARGTPGFQDLDRKVTVSIAELPPGAYDELAKAVFGNPPAGATNVTREMFSFRDGVGYLHEARIVENGVAMKRWLLLAMPAGLKHGFVGVVNVNVPEAADKIYSEPVVRTMLASIVVREPPIDEQLDLIPFRLKELAGFRVMSVAPDSVVVIDGQEDDPSRHPYMIVSIGKASPQQMDDRARFSRDLLAHMPLRDLTLQSAEEMRISGVPGFEIRGRAQDPRNNKIAVVQWVRFFGGGFIRMFAVAPDNKWDETFNRFRAVRDGVEMR